MPHTATPPHTLQKPAPNRAAQSPTPLAKRGLKAHSAIGIAISAVLYIICLSGTVGVFKFEIQAFEQAREPYVASLSPQQVQAASQQGLAADPSTRHLYVHLPTPASPRAIVETDSAEHYLTPKAQLSTPSHTPWTDFLVELHYYLTLPHSFGMLVVAAFGVFLFGMSLTGLVAHPNIFKDAFRFRRGKSSQLTMVDLHNRLSVWTAPFHLTNALTGALIGLAILSAAAIGQLKYGGNAQAVFEPVFGAEPAENLTPAPIARIDKALAYMAAHYPDILPVYVILHDPGTEGQYLQIMAEHADRLIYAEKYNFDGNGTFLGTVGSADGTIGQQVADSVYKVHFGSFGGLPVKAAFFAFGLSLLVIIYAGMRLYFIKQEARGRDMAVQSGLWRGLIVGAPLMLAVTYALSGVVHGGHLTLIFWLGTACTALASTVLNLHQRR